MKSEISLCAPLLVFTYNRIKHTELLLDSLSRLLDRELTDLFIYSDGPKLLSDYNMVREVRTLLRNYKNTSSFKSVTIYENENNRGLAESIITGVTDLINRYGKVIVLEDDLIVGRGFLRFMNSALNYYNSNEVIWAISGYSFPINDLKEDVYFAGRACSWGWATWSDRWDKVDWQVKDYPSFRRNIWKRINFGRWGADMPDMLDRCMLGDIHSWAIRWCYCAWEASKLTVYPKSSFVMNCGTDGSGINFVKEEHRFDTILSNSDQQISFVNPYIDERVRRIFRNKYISLLYYCKISIRVLINQMRWIPRK